MDFAALPPEVNSARMYAGPGAGSLLAASAAWDELAAELHTAAATYRSIVTELTSGPWVGPSSTKMSAAAQPYAVWLTATAEHAELTGAQAKAAATAHSTAFAMTVPPPLIVANRTQLATLVATNFFGQNAPAIAATEAHYAEMWAQDAAAMFSYAASAELASQVTPFAPPPQTANPAGVATQGAGAAQALGQGAAQAAVNAVMETVPTSAVGAAQSIFPPVVADILGDLALIGASPVGTALLVTIIAAFIPEYLIAGAALPSPFGLGEASPMSVAAGIPLGLTPTLSATGSAGLASAMSAGLGNASSVSGLSVPKAWATAAPEMRLAAAELPAPALATAGTPFMGGSPLLCAPPLMGMGGARGTASSNLKEDKAEEAKRRAAKGRRSSMWD